MEKIFSFILTRMKMQIQKLPAIKTMRIIWKKKPHGKPFKTAEYEFFKVLHQKDTI